MQFPLPWSAEGMWQLGTIAIQVSIIALVVAIVLLVAYLAIAIPLYYEPQYRSGPDRARADNQKAREELQWRADVKKALQEISTNSKRA